jgi:hypothetical protein
VNRRDAEAYVGREWTPAGASEARYWAARFRSEGWQAVWDAAQALAAHVRAVRSDYPRDAERRRDFEDHLALRQRLDRASDAFAGR